MGVYLPQQGCKIACYKDEVEILNEAIAICKLSGEVVMIGDTNA